MKPLNLTVLAYDGPMARAYLGLMRARGMQPARVVLLVLARHPATGKPVGRFLPGGLRLRYARKAQDLALNFWPRRLRARLPALVDTIARGLVSFCEEAPQLLAGMAGRFAYEDYCETCSQVLIDGYRDPRLARALQGTPPGTVLYTGGGILPPELLGIEGLRFLHVHPGFLPHVRGADGLLWSMLVRGSPAASCFYMEEDIDTGDIVAATEYEPMRFTLECMTRPDDDTLYRALFSYVDPLLRARLLVENVLTCGMDDLRRIPSQPQSTSLGVVFHFMHPSLRREALQLLFRNA